MCVPVFFIQPIPSLTLPQMGRERLTGGETTNCIPLPSSRGGVGVGSVWRAEKKVTGFLLFFYFFG